MVKVSVAKSDDVLVSVPPKHPLRVTVDGQTIVSGGGKINIGFGLKYDDNGAIAVDTANEVAGENMKPVTSAAVYTEIGNINALLETI